MSRRNTWLFDDIRNHESAFWRRVNKTPTCWLWTGASAGGYGMFWFGQRMRRIPAHCAVWMYKQRRDLPTQKIIRHLCDVPLCMRHLKLGTYGENTREAVRKGRWV